MYVYSAIVLWCTRDQYAQDYYNKIMLVCKCFGPKWLPWQRVSLMKHVCSSVLVLLSIFFGFIVGKGKKESYQIEGRNQGADVQTLGPGECRYVHGARCLDKGLLDAFQRSTRQTPMAH